MRTDKAMAGSPMMQGDPSLDVPGEAGATDNRLSWSPGEFPFTNEWQDGQEYTVSLRIRQTAPGEATVLFMSGSEPSEEQGPVETEEAGYSEPTSSNDYAESENPAVARMLRR